MKNKSVDKKIQEGQSIAVDTLTEIMQSNRNSAHARIKAASTMLSRGGYPELRATISKTISNERGCLGHLVGKREDVVRQIEDSRLALQEAKEMIGERDESDGD